MLLAFHTHSRTYTHAHVFICVSNTKILVCKRNKNRFIHVSIQYGEDDGEQPQNWFHRSSFSVVFVGCYFLLMLYDIAALKVYAWTNAQRQIRISYNYKLIYHIILYYIICDTYIYLWTFTLANKILINFEFFVKNCNKFWITRITHIRIATFMRLVRLQI